MRTQTRMILAVTAGLSLITSACQASDQGQARAIDSTSQRSVDGGDEGDLPVVSVGVDEDGPVTVAEALAASDYVVVAKIASQRDGVRFFGEAGEESVGEDTGYESVEWSLDVEEWIKGKAPETGELVMRATPYIVKADTHDRVATVTQSGVALPLDFGGRYVFFLEQHPEPFGLVTTSSGTGIMELDEQNTLTGQLSLVFEDFRGTPLDKVFPRP